MVDEKKGGLIDEACRAFGIDKKYVFATGEKGGVATIVTVGGHKVRYRAGDVVKALPEHRVTGVGYPPALGKKG